MELNEEIAKKPSLNFIEEIIENDLKSGKHKSIITRFPPEPNGYLHIGHAKSICLNFGVAKKYGGKTNLRFDDTNPVKEDTEYVESIKEDIKWLGFNWAEEHYASDYFEQLYQWAIELIKKGLAYVDDQTLEEMRENMDETDVDGFDEFVQKHWGNQIKKTRKTKEKSLDATFADRHCEDLIMEEYYYFGYLDRKLKAFKEKEGIHS